jgi:hypothetical protein
MIIVTSALIPVSIMISTQGGEFAWGKLVPSSHTPSKTRLRN